MRCMICLSEHSWSLFTTCLLFFRFGLVCFQGMDIWNCFLFSRWMTFILSSSSFSAFDHPVGTWLLQLELPGAFSSKPTASSSQCLSSSLLKALFLSSPFSEGGVGSLLLTSCSKRIYPTKQLVCWMFWNWESSTGTPTVDNEDNILWFPSTCNLSLLSSQQLRWSHPIQWRLNLWHLWQWYQVQTSCKGRRLRLHQWSVQFH